MSRIIILIFFIFVQTFLTAQCPTGRIELYSQTAVDEFKIKYPGCTEISGDLWVKGSDVSNLNGLNAITKVEGSLSVTQTNLKNMLGLYSLQSVG